MQRVGSSAGRCGTGENFTGLSATSGVQTQALTTDRLTTLAAALARLSNHGITPAAIALSPDDALALQTARDASGAFDLGGAVDPATRTAWGTRFAVVPGLAAGDGYVIGQQTVELSHNGQVAVDWNSTGGDLFARNQLVARVETRANLDVLRPHGIVRVSLSA